MKLLLTLTLCALLVFAHTSLSVAKETDIQATVEKVLEQNVDALFQEKDEEMASQVEDLLSSEQSSETAELEGFFNKLWKGVKKVAKKGFKYGKNLYNLYNKLKDCAEVEAMPQEMEDAIMESVFMVHGETEQQDEQLTAELQDFLTGQESAVSAQGRKFQKIWKNAKKLVKKSVKLGRKAYDIYNRVKNGGSCIQATDISDELEDAVAEALFEREKKQLQLAAIEQMLQE